MNAEVSVIIPVYNVEKYLNRCINSVLMQTFKNYEILLIDDGSTDTSGIICDNYAFKYSNIKVIHKSNKGLSDTRNVGIEKCVGDYVYFLDSDDYIIPECLEVLYTNAINNNADLSCGSFGFFDDNHPVKSRNLHSNKFLKCKGENACVALLYGKNFYTSSCNILIRKNIAKANLFPIGKYHEDEMTTFKYFLDSKIVVKTNLDTYYYYQREGSIVHSVGQAVMDEALAADNYVIICGKINSKFRKASLCKKYYLYINIIENYPHIEQDKPEFYNKLINYIRRASLDILRDFQAPLSIKKKALKYLIKNNLKQIKV